MRITLILIFGIGLMFTGSILGQEKKKPKPLTLKNGDVIRLSSSTGGNAAQWISAESDEGAVALVKRKDQSVATMWKVVFQSDGTYLLSLADLKQPRYLHGNTLPGTVTLARQEAILKKQASGAKWEILVVEGNTVRLKCLGHLDGSRWLSADTAAGNCTLVKKGDSSENTLWNVEIIKPTK